MVQKKTVAQIVKEKANYLLCAKDNQRTLKESIENYVQDENLRKAMNTATTKEKGHGGIECRTAYVTDNISWLEERNDWAGLACIGAVRRVVTSNNQETSKERHCYISSRNLTAEEMLRHAHME